MGLGIDCVLYRNTATFGTPTWDACPGISDFTPNAKYDEGDGSTRVSVVKQTEPTQLDLSMSGKLLADGGADYLAFANAFYGRDLIDLMALSGASTVNGNTGVRYEAKVFDWTESQGLGDVSFRSFTVKPCISSNAVQSVLVTAGAPVFTTIA